MFLFKNDTNPFSRIFYFLCVLTLLKMCASSKSLTLGVKPIIDVLESCERAGRDTVSEVSPLFYKEDHEAQGRKVTLLR